MKPDATAITPDEALRMIAELFNERLEAVSPDATRDELKGWDSMGVLMLTAELDERFGLELVSDESSRMKSVADILGFLRAKGVLRE